LATELGAIADALDSDDLEWRFAWATMCDDARCPQRLLRSAIAPLRAALQGPDTRVPVRIRRIDIVNTVDECRSGCVLRGDRLVLRPCLTPGPNGRASQSITVEEVEVAIRDAHELEALPAIARTDRIAS
jgi:hypothetical protein